MLKHDGRPVSTGEVTRREVVNNRISTGRSSKSCINRSKEAIERKRIPQEE